MNELEIFIYGEITPFNDPEYGFYSSQYIVDKLEEAGDDIDTVIVNINSPGGEVVEGFAMYDVLVNSSKIIKTKAVGRCASIATAPFLAAKPENREISENAIFMIHNPWTDIQGDADALIEQAEALRRIESDLANFYAEKIGAKAEDIIELMSKETEFTAQEAVDMGFASNVIQPQNKEVKNLARDYKPVVMCKATINTNKKQMKKVKSKITKTKKLSAFERIKNSAKAMQQAKEEVTVVALDFTLENGDVIQVETGDREEAAVGDPVTIDGEPVDDAEWTLQDGTVLETEGGLVSTIDTSGTEDTDDDDSDDDSSAEDDSTAMNVEELTEAIMEKVGEALEPMANFMKNQAKVNDQIAVMAEAMEGTVGEGFKNSDKNKHNKAKYFNRTGPKAKKTKADEIGQIVDDANLSDEDFIKKYAK